MKEVYLILSTIYAHFKIDMAMKTVEMLMRKINVA